MGEYSSKLGGAIGVAAQLDLAPWVLLQSEISYVTKGTNFTLATTGAPGNSRLSYVIVPLLLAVQLPEAARLKPYLASGLGFGWLTGCYVVYPSDRGDCSQNSKSFDLGLIIGAGVSTRLPWAGIVVLDVRYEHGLSNRVARGLGADYRNRSVLFSIGYYHRLGALVN